MFYYSPVEIAGVKEEGAIGGGVASCLGDVAADQFRISLKSLDTSSTAPPQS